MDPERSDGPTPVARTLEGLFAALTTTTPEQEAVRLERDRELADRARAAQRDVEDCWDREGMPRRVWPIMSAPTETPVLAATREWLRSTSTILILLGLPDRGKTVAACWALAQRRGRFVKAIDTVRHGMFDGEWWDAINSADLVVLDDLGTEPLDAKGYALANVQALFDRAYDGRPRLVVTSNLDIAAFSAQYLVSDGGRSLERVRERGQIVECVHGVGFRPCSLTPRRV